MSTETIIEGWSYVEQDLGYRDMRPIAVEGDGIAIEQDMGV